MGVGLKEAINMAIEVAGQFPSQEIASYLREKVEKLVTSTKLVGRDQIIEVMAQFEKNVETERKNAFNPWNGQPIKQTSHQHAQENYATEALQEVAPFISDDPIRMDFAVEKDRTHMLRAFSQNSEALSPEIQKALDMLFNAWLAEKDMISKNSIIYEADSRGIAITNKDGKAVKADAERVSQLIADKYSGFGAYLKDRVQRVTGKRATIDIINQAYPGQEEQRAIKQDVKGPEVQPPAVQRKGPEGESSSVTPS